MNSLNSQTAIDIIVTNLNNIFHSKNSAYNTLLKHQFLRCNRKNKQHEPTSGSAVQYLYHNFECGHCLKEIKHFYLIFNHSHLQMPNITCF